MPLTSMSSGVEVRSTQTQVSSPRITYPNGFSYTKVDCHAAILQVLKLKEELEKAEVEKENGIQAAKEKAVHAEKCTKKAEVERKSALNELNTLRAQVAAANQNVARGWEALDQMKGEEIDEQGKSFLPHVDITVCLKWELNKDGVPIWPLTILEEGEVLDSLPSFNAWVTEMPNVEVEPSSTLPFSQFALSSAHDKATSSIPVALTNN
ncbi:hypothetical protein SLEP1_g36918 [Rubroshorea leprosula]|uniref:Uncharacterized protein n=1 Tax=Rubroshorea leprosula TaxID=152421 RepID=A0AAV5KT01_9ROSI|nr:hypothetical protein SLEP1_g36918 [Rubroshorea leprosula]